MNEQEKLAFKEKINSLGYRGRKPAPKVTVYDARDTGSEHGVVTEHWDGRIDSHITPATVRMGARFPSEGD